MQEASMPVRELFGAYLRSTLEIPVTEPWRAGAHHSLHMSFHDQAVERMQVTFDERLQTLNGDIGYCLEAIYDEISCVKGSYQKERLQCMINHFEEREGRIVQALKKAFNKAVQLVHQHDLDLTVEEIQAHGEKSTHLLSAWELYEDLQDQVTRAMHHEVRKTADGPQKKIPPIGTERHQSWTHAARGSRLVESMDEFKVDSRHCQAFPDRPAHGK